ncbi:unnamed protein product, partial [Ascophyllum nodosum]
TVDSGVKATEGGHLVGSSKPMACTQQQHIDRQANGGAGERISLLDIVDSGVKATEGGHLVGSSKPMACTQHRQANGGAGERISLLDTVDSGSATQAEPLEEMKPESEESSQVSREGPSLGVDLGFVVVAVTAMIVMSIPEDHHWALWILCCL